MANLTCEYLGLLLKNPLVPSASPFTKEVSEAVQLEDAGASAVIMHSLFEEEIKHHQNLYVNHIADSGIGFAEADSFSPEQPDYADVSEQYLEQIQNLKSKLSMPVIASINGTGTGDWLSIATEIEKAGADALELNLYSVPTNFEASSNDIEQMYLRLFKTLRKKTNLPIAVKLCDQLSSPGHFIRELEKVGAQGVSLFNRFYQPDFDLNTGQLYSSLKLSGPADYYRVMHWMALLHNKTNLSLGATSGVHSSEVVLKLIGAGANVVHSASCILKQGPMVLTQWLKEMDHWMEEFEVSSIDELRGRFSFSHVKDAGTYERINYYQNLSGYKS